MFPSSDFYDPGRRERETGLIRKAPERFFGSAERELKGIHKNKCTHQILETGLIKGGLIRLHAFLGGIKSVYAEIHTLFFFKKTSEIGDLGKQLATRSRRLCVPACVLHNVRILVSTCFQQVLNLALLASTKSKTNIVWLQPWVHL